MSFASDLKIWENAQREFAKILLDNTSEFRIVSIEFAQGKFKDWDIKIDCIPDWILTYEVKTDTMADKTWNFVIETRFKWEASGIYASKADYIVYCVKNERYIQKRGELILRLIDTPKRTTKWWDWFNSELYVISCDELDKLFTHLNTNPINNGNGETGQSDSWDSTEVSWEI